MPRVDVAITLADIKFVTSGDKPPVNPCRHDHGAAFYIRPALILTRHMSINANAAYRVHVEGMNPTERKVFSGMIHLAERNGTIFEVEAILENSDVFIFDGANQKAIEFEKSHSHIAQSTIWINPPAHLNAIRQISRPFRWSSLLEMMEQMVRGHHNPDVAAHSQAIAKITFGQLCDLGERILRKHIGVAAGFVVEDVRAERGIAADPNEPATADVFLDILKRHLPTNVDASKVILEISDAIRSGCL